MVQELHLGGLNLSITYTEMVHLLPHSCLLYVSEVHDLHQYENRTSVKYIVFYFVTHWKWIEQGKMRQKNFKHHNV